MYAGTKCRKTCSHNIMNNNIIVHRGNVYICICNNLQFIVAKHNNKVYCNHNIIVHRGNVYICICNNLQFIVAKHNNKVYCNHFGCRS